MGGGGGGGGGGWSLEFGVRVVGMRSKILGCGGGRGGLGELRGVCVCVVVVAGGEGGAGCFARAFGHEEVAFGSGGVEDVVMFQ